MQEAILTKIAGAWIAGLQAEENTPEYESHWWAIDEPELLWRFILNVYKRDVPDKVSAVLAAGPLEDLLSYFGADYIDRVEKLAAEDQRFNWLLGGVHRLEMTDAVWSRVQAVRLEVW